jgi:type I restriction enzyme S subunit
MKQSKLKDLFDYLPKSKIKAGEGLTEGQYPFYTSSGSQSKFLEDFQHNPGCLIFGTGGKANVHFSTNNFSVSTDCITIKPKPIAEIDAEYVYHYFKGNMRVLEKGFKGAGLKHISKAYLSDIQIPYFKNTDDQKRTVYLFDKVEKLINQRKQNIQQLDDLLKSVFLDMFGDPVKNEKHWDTLPFHKIGKFTSGGTPSKSRDDFWSGTFPWVSPKDMKIEKIRDSINHISEAVFEETTLKKILPNHLLIVVRGMILAHSFPVAVNAVDISINQDMKAIKPISDFDVEYLLNCLIALKRQILELITTAGHGTRKFDSNAMQKLIIPKPPKTLQQKFSDVANKVSIIKSQYQQSLNDLESLYGALSQKAFNGELDLSKVPLPDESEEISDDMSSVDQGNMTENNKENSMFGFSQFNPESIQDNELRRTQLSKWFTEWLEHYQQESDLNINHFWQCIEFTTQDYVDDNDEPLKIDVSDYDYIKGEVFAAIKSGVIKQTTNMIETIVDGKTQLEPGNQILLKNNTKRTHG